MPLVQPSWLETKGKKSLFGFGPAESSVGSVWLVRINYNGRCTVYQCWIEFFIILWILQILRLSQWTDQNGSYN